jgi:hypothetical protein
MNIGMPIFFPEKVNSGRIYYAKTIVHSRIKTARTPLYFVKCRDFTEDWFYPARLLAKRAGASLDSANPARNPFLNEVNGAN